MLEDLYAAPEGSLVVLHTSSHNPTGLDPSKEQWQEIAKVFQERKLLAFFDCAFAVIERQKFHLHCQILTYCLQQGFASGSIYEDAYPVRLFDDLGMEFLAAQCFSKNMGLTNERVGHLTIRFANK